MRRACQITLNDADRLILERWSRGRSTQARLVTRARVVLSAAEGKENKDIAVELHISRGAVARWRDRLAKAGVAGLEKDAPRGGRPHDLDLHLIVDRPPDGERRIDHQHEGEDLSNRNPQFGSRCGRAGAMRNFPGRSWELLSHCCRAVKGITLSRHGGRPIDPSLTDFPTQGFHERHAR
jgi:Winged helix-turn helix